MALSCGKKSTKEENCPPAINELKPSKWAVDFQTDVVITARTSDRDGEKLSSTWKANWGVFKVTSRDSAILTSPSHPVIATLILRISDGKGEKIETAFR